MLKRRKQMKTYTILGYIGDTTLQQVNVPLEAVDFVIETMEAQGMEVVILAE